METRAWDRWAPASGIGFVVLYVIAFLPFLVVGESPALGDSAEEVAEYFTDNRSAVLTAVILLGLAVPLFLAFVAAAAVSLRRAGEPLLAGIALATGVTAAAMFGALVVTFGALAQGVARTADAGVAKAIYDVSWSIEVLVSFPAAMFVLVVSAGGIGAGILPRWFGWLGVVAALAFAVGGTTWASSGFWAPDGGYTTLTELVFLAWLLAVSVLLLRRPQPAEAGQAAAAAM
jgi:hypothetical protein